MLVHLVALCFKPKQRESPIVRAGWRLPRLASSFATASDHGATPFADPPPDQQHLSLPHAA